MSRHTRVAIVGAGPQGLTAAVYLVHAGVDPSDIVVYDPAGEWLSGWRRSFAHLQIEHLRSAGVHHPHPQPYALTEFARARRRASELHHTYSLPSTKLFDDFCSHVIDSMGLGGSVRRDVVLELGPDGAIETQSGERLAADHVVSAYGRESGRRPTGRRGRRRSRCRCRRDVRAHQPLTPLATEE